MNYEHLVEYVLLGGAGALVMEAMKAWELKRELGSKEVKKLLKDPFVWVVGLAFFIGAGFIAWAVNASGADQPLPVIASGIGARSIVRGFIEAKNAGQARLATASNMKKWFS